MCNDNGHGVQTPLGTIADYAQAVLDDPDWRCNFVNGDYGGSGISKDVVWGQVFDVNGWLVFAFSLSFLFFLFSLF